MNITCPKCKSSDSVGKLYDCDKSSLVKCTCCNNIWRTKSKKRFELPQNKEFKRKPKSKKSELISLPSGAILWTPTTIRFLLSQNNYSVLRGMVVLYDNQTFDEKLCENTFIRNGKGFDAYDAKICSRIALKIKTGEHITKKEMDLARRKTMKYAKQLADKANSNIKKI